MLQAFRRPLLPASAPLPTPCSSLTEQFHATRTSLCMLMTSDGHCAEPCCSPHYVPYLVICTNIKVLTAGNQQVTSSQLLKELWLREGWRGLFAGTGARVMSIAPGSAISWMLYEKIMKLL